MSGSAFSFLSPGRIVFGRGTRDQTASTVRGFGNRALLVRGRSVRWVDDLETELRGLGLTVTSVYGAGEPTVCDVESALVAGREAGAEIVIAVGGGAVLDLGKAVAALLPGRSNIMDHLEGVGLGKPLLDAPLPYVAVPTTSGTGAEVTKNAVISVPDAGRKVSLRDDRMIPDVAIVDPALTDNAPRAQTLASGLDALTQVIEPYVSQRSNVLTDALCRQAIPMGAGALAQLVQTESQTARDDMAFVSLAGGLALANAGLGAIHGLAGVLGGRLGAPHGLICGRLLGPVLSANRIALDQEGLQTERFNEIARWLSGAFLHDPSTIFDAFPQILDGWAVPRLSEWVTQDTDFDAIAMEAAGSSSMKANPCVLSQSALVQAMRLAI